MKREIPHEKWTISIFRLNGVNKIETMPRHIAILRLRSFWATVEKLTFAVTEINLRTVGNVGGKHSNKVD